MTSAVADLEAAIGELMSDNDEEYISANRVINPLLSIWKRANDLSPEVARPVEELLTSLSGRKLVQRSELESAMSTVRDTAFGTYKPEVDQASAD